MNHKPATEKRGRSDRKITRFENVTLSVAEHKIPARLSPQPLLGRTELSKIDSNLSLPYLFNRNFYKHWVNERCNIK